MALTRAVERWFGASARALPWRTEPRDAWASLVSEIMAQQTQIARVAERFGAFMARFPTPAAMAAAGEDDVLAMWSGLGYYRRARLLREAAVAIVERHGGRVPGTLAELLALPGVGRYTAGAVASIAMGRREAIVDGNVAGADAGVWAGGGRGGSGNAGVVLGAGGALVGVAESAGRFNEGLMELGAVVCSPRGPGCGVCPLASVCEARRLGRQEEIPAAKVRGETPRVWAVVLVAVDGCGRVLVERRGSGGGGAGERSGGATASGRMWEGMWQAPTLEGAKKASAAGVRRWACGAVGRRVLGFEHQTSHRLFEFDVRRVVCGAERAAALLERAGAGERRWVGVEEAMGLAMSSPQRRIVGEVGLGGMVEVKQAAIEMAAMAEGQV
ncbi:MAG: hypothetical protein R3B68_01175 [Phycisphaerales bacterium]